MEKQKGGSMKIKNRKEKETNLRFFSSLYDVAGNLAAHYNLQLSICS